MTMTNQDAFIQAVQQITEKGTAPSLPPDTTAQAATIEQVVSNLGIAGPNVFSAVTQVLQAAAAVRAPCQYPQPGTEDVPLPRYLAGQDPVHPCDPKAPANQNDPINYRFTPPGVLGVPVPAPGTYSIEELFGAKATDPVDKFFINIAATVASVFSTFFGLGSIQAREVLDQFNAAHQTLKLSPADLADMVERNILTEEDAAQEAEAAGLNCDRFHNLVLDTGEPPGLMEMLSLWRRNLIDLSQLYQAVAYSRVRTEYFQDLLHLAYSPMSPAEVVEARLKNVIDNDQEAKQRFEQGGGLGSDFCDSLATAGNAIGVEQAANLRNHNLIDDTEFQAVILHSRINPTFEPMAQLLRHRWLSPFQIHQALVAGTATQTQACEWLLQDGYSQDQASAFATAAAAPKVQKPKEETESQLLELHQAGFLPDADFCQGMKELGYSADESNFLLQLSDARRVIAGMNQAVAHTHAAFLVNRIDHQQAVQDLTALGVPNQAITQYLTDWGIEKATQFKELTEAQVSKFVKGGYLKPGDGIRRLMNMGYAQEGAQLLIAEAAGVPPAQFGAWVTANPPTP